MARKIRRNGRSTYSLAADMRETRLQLQLIAGVGFLFLAAGLFIEQVLLR